MKLENRSFTEPLKGSKQQMNAPHVGREANDLRISIQNSPSLKSSTVNRLERRSRMVSIRLRLSEHQTIRPKGEEFEPELEELEYEIRTPNWNQNQSQN